MDRDDVLIVGAGAAGLMAAIFAGEAGANVTLVESTPDGGKKILISGGGRCNVLPSALDTTRYVTASSPNSLRKILLSWPLPEQRRFFETVLGIPLALEEESGKLFPASNRARDIRDGLVERARGAGVRIVFDARVDSIQPDESGWRADAGGGEFLARRLVLATGGLSVPKTGSDGRGLRAVEALGHTIHSLYPALTPLTTDPPVHAGLAGVSLEVRLTAPPPAGPVESRGGFLFTHRGYSGPAVLDISHVATTAKPSIDQPILASWSDRGEAEWLEDLTSASGRVSTILRRVLPDRLASQLMLEAGVRDDQTTSQLRREDRGRLIDHLVRYPLPWTGDEGYRKAEVTGGGVSLAEVDPRTLESRLHPGLFLCGELLDAFGPIGGYNFAWAWATGRAAGSAAARAADPDRG